MLPGRTPTEKMASLNRLFASMIGRTPTVNEEVFQSEWQTANRNRALAYYLKDTDFLDCKVEDALEVYLKQCSIER